MSLVLGWLLTAITLLDDPPKTPEVTAKDPALRAELLRRTKVDQDARFALVNWSKTQGAGNAANMSAESKAEYVKMLMAMKKIDHENTKWLKEIIEKQGWLTISMVAKDGAQSAWLLVQHADDDPKFQRHCLDLMTKSPRHEVSQSNLAYLTDRVLLAEGKKQLYGTQFATIDGKMQPRPLEDEKNVDKRRAEMGLSTLEEYARVIRQQYGGGEVKK